MSALPARTPGLPDASADADLERRFGGLRRLYGDLTARSLVECR